MHKDDPTPVPTIQDIEERARLKERVAIEMWLRKQPNLVAASPDHVRSNSPKMLADAIARGDHLSNGGEGGC